MSRVDKSTKSFRPVARPPLKKAATPSLSPFTALRAPSLAPGPLNQPPSQSPPSQAAPPPASTFAPEPAPPLPPSRAEADNGSAAPALPAHHSTPFAPSEPPDDPTVPSQPRASSTEPATPPRPKVRAAAETDAKSRMIAVAKAARERSGRRLGSTPGPERQRSSVTPAPAPAPADAASPPTALWDALADREEGDYAGGSVEPRRLNQGKKVVTVSVGMPIDPFESFAFSSPPSSPQTSFRPADPPVARPAVAVIVAAAASPVEPDPPLFREASADLPSDIPVEPPSAQVGAGQASPGKKRKLGAGDEDGGEAPDHAKKGKIKAKGNVIAEPAMDHDEQDDGDEPAAPAQAKKGRKTAIKPRARGKRKSKADPPPGGEAGVVAGEEGTSAATAQPSGQQYEPASSAIIAGAGGGDHVQEDEEDEEDISPRLKRQRLIAKRRARGKGGASAPSADPPRAKRKPKAAQQEGGGQLEGGEEGAGRAKRKPRAKPSADPAKRKRRKPTSVPRPIDPDDPQDVPDGEGEDDPGPIDPMTITMEDICADSERGRASSMLQERMVKIRERQRREKEERQRERARRATRGGEEQGSGEEEAAGGFADESKGAAGEAGGEPDQDGEGEAEDEQDLPDLDAAMEGALTSGPASWDEGSAGEGPGGDDAAEDGEDDDEAAPVRSMFAPRLRMVNGQMVLDQDSLQVDHQAANLERLEAMEVVEGGDELRMVNAATWSKHQRSERWGAEETERFYDALRMFGTDFEMIARLFPGRNRRQIRNKFNREEKLRPEVLTAAVTGKSKKAVKLEEYGRAAGRDLTGPAPEDPMDAWREHELGGGEGGATAGKAKSAGGDDDDENDEDGDGEPSGVVVDDDDEEAELPDPMGDERQTPAWGEQGLLDTWQD